MAVTRAHLLDNGIGSLLLEHVPTAVAILDKEMRFLGASRRWLSDYRVEPRDIVGRSHCDVFPEASESWREVHRRVLAGEQQSKESEPILRQDGTTDWVRWTMIPWKYKKDEVQGAIFISEILNDAVQSRDWLVALEAEFDLLINNATHTSVLLTDTWGRIALWNDGAERMFGWKAGEILGEPLAVLFRTDDRDCASPTSLHSQATGGIVPGQSAIRVRKDGTEFSCISAVSELRGEIGNLVGFALAYHDTSEAMEQKARIEAREALLQSVLETVPDAMVTIDEEGTIKSFSTAAERLFGYGAVEVVGRNVSMLMPEPDASLHDSYIARYKATGEKRILGKARRVLGRRKDGSLFPHELYIGEALGGGTRIFTGFVRDLTQRELAEAELQQVQQEVIGISRISAIGTMATALAHDLNQPLTAIANYLQSATALMSTANSGNDGLLREALTEAGREAMRASEIVRRLRQFIGRGELERKQCSVRDILVDACAIALPQDRRRGIQCRIDIPEDLADAIVDRVQIQQVLINLLQNAIEAIGSNGSVRVEAKRAGQNVEVSVVDTGPGIPPGKEEHLFDPFVTSKANGMGLGLAISRTIVEAHGGKLWCENAPEGGAAFYFSLPVAETPDE